MGSATAGGLFGGNIVSANLFSTTESHSNQFNKGFGTVGGLFGS